MTKKKKYVIRKPSCRNGVWGYSVCEGASPLSKEIEFIKCGSREAAFKGYAHAKRQEGTWL